MSPPLELSIPSTILSHDESSAKPFTLYNITIRLPLRTFVVQKRYSEFAALHSALTSVVSAPPPAPLPKKTWFKSTTSSPELTEMRRQGLEAYMRVIAEGPDRRWRETSVWRNFLNLPSTTGSSNSNVKNDLVAAHQRYGGSHGGALLAEPTVWLDVHREMKSQLHDARLFLGRRDGATSSQVQYEAGANAKRCLVKAGGLIGNLEEGLRILSENEKKNGGGGGGVGGVAGGLGAGELRRRRDLLANAKVEREGLEKLAVSLAVKSQSISGASGTTNTMVSTQDKTALIGRGVSKASGRVLGAPVPETDKTRELDNGGVLTLQKQMMHEQDLDVEQLAQIVRRQKDMGLAIHNELALQNELLKHVDDDVDRLTRKIQVAKKRTSQIS